MSEFEIRRVEARDLKRYKELCDGEAWNIGMDIFEKMLESTPNGFWCAEELSSKHLISFCGAVDIGNKKAIISTFVTDPKRRGKGIGSKVLKKIMEVFEGYEMIVNAADGREPLYARFGMPHWMYQVLQIICEPKEIRKSNASSIIVSELGNIEEILDYDRAVAKEDRRNSLPWFHETSLSSLVARENCRVCVFTKSRVWNQLSAFLCSESRSLPSDLGKEPGDVSKRKSSVHRPSKQH
ncbi:Oidioi.mRNA.OKI2018_I69.PAR.g9301.t1.cds [Oikopleura dioica]|uniref:Oidioi.mRNA.OKI2018_I69.PAR.g9301.t1.cds n=1 Tax=Oikopleura dioica TaxID=34765 RepID=A0ABN7RNG8_OIKDI|nr:Oidioi.mRNA.OKI2018_I69.PAR.g9301.t1.cds [Oikopleura dioica]